MGVVRSCDPFLEIRGRIISLESVKLCISTVMILSVSERTTD